MGPSANALDALAEGPGGEVDAAVGVNDQVAFGAAPTVAIPSALRTSVVVWVLSIDQPTTRRLKASRTTQQ